LLSISEFLKKNIDCQLYETDKYFNYCKKALKFLDLGTKKIG